MRKRTLLLPILLLLTACSFNPSPQNTIIDWVDFVKWNDTTYEANYEINKLNKDWETAGEIGEVKYILDGHAGTNHQTKNGDAAYLQKGTKLFAMKGYDPAFRIIADGKVYEVTESDTAETVGDFIDIKGKVQRVILQSEQDLSFIGEFSDEHAEQLVEELLVMPYEPDRRATEGKRVFFGIELVDGTMTRSVYWSETGYVHYGGVASQKIKDIFEVEMDENEY
ncbi:hypothetical protein CSV71_08005 [Sporosarcina sp. P21c]|uniref:hypothetical protein n=1 Tax=unclassified Sporosarcina TaxID=2647733 RepID=UPI000C164ABD|nr:MULTISPECIES: hypothetical protein [unclassified Sporosarcina]PIC66748.1 hypothetical protein CSV78_11225 [Sporosarcina sp. P16a]PIC89883.1 hypothetical protein CSV71_08005 [Sporosarcina sp. P21c]PIC93269.1 hypothetical protein CSV70_06820 [Sporosarcina sp. P25]